MSIANKKHDCSDKSVKKIVFKTKYEGRKEKEEVSYFRCLFKSIKKGKNVWPTERIEVSQAFGGRNIVLLVYTPCNLLRFDLSY